MLKQRALCLLVALATGPLSAAEVRIGSKTLTESVILGDIAERVAVADGVPARHERELGGTQVVWKALLQGDIDLCADYTGTLRMDLLGDPSLVTLADIRRALGAQGLAMTDPLGFNNTYAIGMPEALAAKLGIARISDLRRFPQLKLGFSQEFSDRPDGWKAVRAKYALPHTDVQMIEHELAYRAAGQGVISVTDVYSTDAEIRSEKLRVLEDDLHYFPVYEAVYVYRQDLKRRHPSLVAKLEGLSGTISAEAMIRMNARAKLDRVSETRVAEEFLRERMPSLKSRHEPTFWERLVDRLREHLFLVGVSLFSCILVALPLGILAVRRPTLGQCILGVSGIIQTIPALALLVFMMPLLGIGPLPAIVALFLYSLLPIVRNTYTGLLDVSVQMHESAAALGLPKWSQLRRVELPIASRAILAGIKTSAVVNVGTATLGALIGAGGFGHPILVGIRRNDISMILEGAIPAAVLAILVQLAFELGERWIVPRGIRLQQAA